MHSTLTFIIAIAALASAQSTAKIWIPINRINPQEVFASIISTIPGVGLYKFQVEKTIILTKLGFSGNSVCHQVQCRSETQWLWIARWTHLDRRIWSSSFYEHLHRQYVCFPSTFLNLTCEIWLATLGQVRQPAGSMVELERAVWLLFIMISPSLGRRALPLHQLYSRMFLSERSSLSLHPLPTPMEKLRLPGSHSVVQRLQANPRCQNHLRERRRCLVRRDWQWLPQMPSGWLEG